MNIKFDDESEEKMVTTSFLLPKDVYLAIKAKLGMVPASKLYRILLLKWLNNEIEITKDDIQKYGK